MIYRIGLGEDSHRYTNIGRGIVVGGVNIKTEFGIEANSDGDVLYHALCNALSSAVGKGSLATYADALVKQGERRSSAYLLAVKRTIMAESFVVENVAASVEASRPLLEKYSREMADNISQNLDINSSRVGITFTTGEGLTAFGRGEGIRALVTVLLAKSQ